MTGKIFYILLISLLTFSCAASPPRQSAEEWSVLKTPLIAGEKIARANSCSLIPALSLTGVGSAKFGSLFLTNLRLIYEESAWFRALDTAAKFVPTSGDFGLKSVISGGLSALDTNFIIARGREGKLKIVKKEGRIIIPLSALSGFKTAGSRTTLSPRPDEPGERWLILNTSDGIDFIFEIYDLPPDRTGLMPPYVSAAWGKEIIRLRQASFGTIR